MDEFLDVNGAAIDASPNFTICACSASSISASIFCMAALWRAYFSAVEFWLCPNPVPLLFTSFFPVAVFILAASASGSERPSFLFFLFKESLFLLAFFQLLSLFLRHLRQAPKDRLFYSFCSKSH